jgi:hypothetical protein
MIDLGAGADDDVATNGDIGTDPSVGFDAYGRQNDRIGPDGDVGADANAWFDIYPWHEGGRGMNAHNGAFLADKFFPL